MVISKEDLKDINERLGKAIGFKYYISPIYCKWPDGTVDPMPDFTSSMDACIKWVYPELHKPVEIGNTQGGWCCRVGHSGWVKEASLPLAFCLASIRYIEGVE